MRISVMCVFFACHAFSFSINSDEKVVWAPVTKNDWDLAQDSSKGIRDAIMIFEKIMADDRKFKDKEFILRIYRRIKIFNSRGKHWADVSVPYDPEKSKIKMIAGRTILPDGAIIELNTEKILEKEVMKTEDMKVKEMFFSLPGVVDSCIVEYYYEFENKKVNPVWVVQKEISLIEGEYRWKFFQGNFSTSNFFLDFLMNAMSAPNYLSVNNMNKMKIENIPSSDKPEEVVFRFNDMPAFQSEPYSIPDEAAKTHLRFYYGSGGDEDEYWSFASGQMSLSIKSFTSEHDKVKELVAKEFSNLPSTNTKVTTVYRWIQEHIKNTTFSEFVQGRNNNENVDDVLKHGSGSKWDIASLFYSMLKELDIQPGVVFAINREEHLLYKVAKYWQFDQPMIFVNDSLQHSHFYSPADPCLEPGQIPWYFEGTKALVIGAPIGTPLFAELNKSRAEQNTIRREIRLLMTPNQETQGTVKEYYVGHSAEQLKILLRNKQEKERVQIIKKEIMDNLSADWKDSVTISSIDDRHDSLIVTYELRGPLLEPDASGRVIFSPRSLFIKIQNPFSAPTRKYPLVFKYAVKIVQTFNFNIPKGLNVENIPAPIWFSNHAGDVQENITQSEDSLLVSSQYMLREPIFSENFYDEVKELHHQHQTMDDYAIVFKQTIDKVKKKK